MLRENEHLALLLTHSVRDVGNQVQELVGEMEDQIGGVLVNSHLADWQGLSDHSLHGRSRQAVVSRAVVCHVLLDHHLHVEFLHLIKVDEFWVVCRPIVLRVHYCLILSAFFFSQVLNFIN